MAKNLLILTQYYLPETGAPQNRLASLAGHLQRLGWQTRVLTAMPNYPRNAVYPGYENKKYVEESINGVRVLRTWIYVSASRSIIVRLLNYFSFVYSSWRVGRKLSGIDLILCESPPLFLGITAVLLKRRYGAKLVFNVSDLWPESAVKLNIITNPFVIKASYWLESRIYKAADLITCQTQGIEKDIKSRFSQANTHWLPNGFDFDENPLPDDDKWVADKSLQGKKIIVYAGVMGHAQGLDTALHAAGMLLERHDIRFVMIGDGPEYSKLQALKTRLGLDNVIFTGHQPRQQVLRYLAISQAALVPLKNIPLFRGAIPSKIFEALALRKPIILGVDGEARELFIERVSCGIYYEPENALSLKNSILTLIDDQATMQRMGEEGYRYVQSVFNRKVIAEALHNKLLDLAT